MKMEEVEGRDVRWWYEEVGRGIRFVFGIPGRVGILEVEVQLFRSSVDVYVNMKEFGIEEMVFESAPLRGEVEKGR